MIQYNIINKMGNTVPLLASCCDMCKLASYYDFMGEYSNMEKYYLMAMDRGCLKAHFRLESYYYSIGEYSNKMAEYHINKYKQRQLQSTKLA